MENLELKSLDDLYAMLLLIDSELEKDKAKRHNLLENKAQELDDKFAGQEDQEEVMITKHRLLDEYKEELNKELEIDALRQKREKVRNVIWEKEKQEDSKPNENFMSH